MEKGYNHDEALKHSPSISQIRVCTAVVRELSLSPSSLDSHRNSDVGKQR